MNRTSNPNTVDIKQARAIGSARQWVGIAELSKDCTFTFDWQYFHGSAYLPQDYLNDLLWETPDRAARELVKFILEWVPFYRDLGARDGWRALRSEAYRAHYYSFQPGTDPGETFTVWAVQQIQSGGAA